MVAVVAIATASAAAEIDSALCGAWGDHAEAESETADTSRTEGRSLAASPPLALRFNANAPCAVHSHGRCVHISPDPGLVLRTLQRPLVPAPPLCVTDANGLFGDSPAGTALRNPAAIWPIRFGDARSPILRC